MEYDQTDNFPFFPKPDTNFEKSNEDFTIFVIASFGIMRPGPLGYIYILFLLTDLNCQATKFQHVLPERLRLSA